MEIKKEPILLYAIGGPNGETRYFSDRIEVFDGVDTFFEKDGKWYRRG